MIKAPERFATSIGADIEKLSADLQLIDRWANSYESEKSKDAAKKEGMRLALWLASKSMGLGELSIEEIADFKKFLLNPRPKAIWVGKKVRIDNQEEWRPFAGPLVDSSARTAFAYLRSLYNFLKILEVTKENPFAQSRSKVKFKNSDCKSFQKKIFSTAARQLIGEYFEKNPDDLPAKELQRRRLLFLFAFHTGARRGEISAARLSDFYQDSNGLYWWRVVGKGKKYDEVPVSDQLLEILTEDLSTRSPEHGISRPINIARLPNLPLLTSSHSEIKPLSAHRVWSLFKDTAQRIANHFESHGEPEIALEVSNASTHWLRHSSASFQLTELGLSLAEVRDNLRHATIATTSVYLDTEDRIRHDKMAKAKF